MDSTRKILIADDDAVTRKMLVFFLEKAGFEVIVCHNGLEAWEALITSGARLAILDWIMPGVSGVELCRQLRARSGQPYVYMILLTIKSNQQDLAEAFNSGADDFLIKPINQDLLMHRIQIGQNILSREHLWERKVNSLEQMNLDLATRRKLIPICAYCKKVKNDHEHWQQVESYLHEQAGINFTHGVCPECLGELVDPDNSPSGQELSSRKKAFSGFRD